MHLKQRWHELLFRLGLRKSTLYDVPDTRPWPDADERSFDDPHSEYYNQLKEKPHE